MFAQTCVLAFLNTMKPRLEQSRLSSVDSKVSCILSLTDKRSTVQHLPSVPLSSGSQVEEEAVGARP